MVPQGIVDPPPHTARVLIVEDEALIRSLLAEELRSRGLTVVEAATADEAWTLLTTGETLDIIISDVTMPGAMSGIELATRVKQHHPGLPVILTSGNPGARNVAAIAPFLLKPYRLDDAAALILQTIGSAP